MGSVQERQLIGQAALAAFRSNKKIRRSKFIFFIIIML